VFGSLCYARILQQTKENSFKGHQNVFFIGFQRGTKEYVLLNIQSREIFVSRDVVFYEHVFPYQRVQDTSNETNNPKTNPNPLINGLDLKSISILTRSNLFGLFKIHLKWIKSRLNPFC